MRNFLITVANPGLGQTKYETNILRSETYPQYDKVYDEMKKQNKHALHGSVISISELSDQGVQ